ncbi:MAG: hypothetical protein EXS17_07400 [Phycisphaerales bacterium]|nr:hypothetical protein [Phycisphaerales bacterium]
MKAIVITKRGDPVAPNVAFVTDRLKPSAVRGEVLVQSEASALNSLDLWVGRGLPGIDTPYPFSSGSDGAGRVVEVGEGVDTAWIGRRILLNAAVVQHEPCHPDHRASGENISMIGEHTPGTMAEFFVAPAINVLDIGEADPVQAAAFGLTHLTAWRMLVTRAHLQPGMTVLVTGIGGGVAVALLNIAKHFGCDVIVTSRHQSKLDRARELGASHGILDVGTDWSREVRAITKKRGVDIVADSIGKAVHLSSIKSLVRGGVFVTCGATTGGDATTDLSRVFWNQLTIVGATMGDMSEFRTVASLFGSGAISPVVDSVHKPQDAKKAFARLEGSNQFGKIVIDWK